MDLTLNKFIEEFNMLPLEDKEYLIDIMEKNLIEAKREKLFHRIKECEGNLEKGEIKKGTVQDLYEDLEND